MLVVLAAAAAFDHAGEGVYRLFAACDFFVPALLTNLMRQFPSLAADDTFVSVFHVVSLAVLSVQPLLVCIVITVLVFLNRQRHV